MMDVALLKSGINLIDVVGQYSELRKAGANEYCGPCCFCGGDDRMRVFNDHFFCRPGPGHCGRKGDAIEFIKEIKHVDFKEACTILGGGSIIADAPLKPVAHATNGATEYVWDGERQEADLLKSHAQLTASTGKYAKQCLAYLESRGLTLDTVEAFRIGYKAVGLPGMNGEQKELAIALPWFDQDGALVSIKYRFTEPHTYTDKNDKKRTETKTSRGSSKGHVFGWQALRNAETLIVVEGEINAMSIWQVTNYDVLSVGSMYMFDYLPDSIVAIATKYKRVIVWSDEKEFTEAAALKLGARTMATEKDANELLQDGNLAEEIESALGFPEPLPPDPPKDEPATEQKVDTYPYAVHNGCIGEWKERKTRDGEVTEYFVKLCNFDAWIVADVAADDGEEVSRKIALAGKLENGINLPEIEINADDFEAMKWPVALWGARVSIEPIKGASNILRAAIQRLSENRMVDRRTMTHTGWSIIDGKRVFLHAGGAIGSENVSVGLSRYKLGNYVFPSDNAIDPVEAMKESLKLLEIAPARVSNPLWAAMFLAPLSEIIPPVFTISVEGGSGSLKSSYSAVMLNHYGPRFDEFHMPADWLSTANSLEKLCFHAKDVVLIIDDLRPSTNPTENRKLQESVSHITRSVGNRQGRGRLDGENQFRREYIPRGLVMITAERKALGKSTNSRIITLDVEPGDIDSLMLSKAQQQRHVYGYAMVGYIQWLNENWEELSKALPAQVAELRAANSGSGHHKRLPNATAIIYAAFNCAMNYAVEIGAISDADAKQRMTHCYFALQSIAESQNQTTESEDPAIKYLMILASLISQNKAHIAAKSKNEALVTFGLPSTEKLGWHDGHNVYLPPGAYNAVCKFATAEGWSFPSDENTLRKELDRGGFITKKQDGKLTTKQRAPGDNQSINVTAVSYDKFVEILVSMGVDL